MFYDHQKVGDGVILRDSKGDLILAASILENEVHNLETVEALTILRGIQLCLHQGVHNLIIESDSQIYVNELLQQESSLSEIGNLLTDIRTWIQNFYNGICNLQTDSLKIVCKLQTDGVME